MTNFDNQSLKTLRGDIDAALKQIASKHGINLSIGTISYSGEKFTTRITGLSKTSVVKKSVIPNLFESYGIKFGDTFKVRTKTMTIVGYNPSKPKNSVELVDQNGKKFGASFEMVKRMLGK